MNARFRMTGRTPIELVLDCKATLGEGVCWDAGRQLLYWVDIPEGTVHVFDPATGENRSRAVGQPVGAAVPTKSGKLLVAMHHGFALLDTGTEELKPLLDPEEDKPDNRFNDGKCDPAGRFWAGTMQLKAERGAGALYRLDADLTVHMMVEGVSVSNGLAWSPELDRMYYIDSPRREVTVFDYDHESGDITNPRAVVRLSPDEGHPDGMTIDETGMLWVAHYGGGCLSRWDPANGERIDTIPMPVRRVTDCVFGGRDLDILYVSTARNKLTEDELEQQPAAGGLFALKPGVRGIAAPPFGA